MSKESTLVFPVSTGNAVWFISDDRKTILDVVDPGQQRKAKAAEAAGQVGILGWRGKVEREVKVKYIDRSDLRLYWCENFTDWFSAISSDAALLSNFNNKYSIANYLTDGDVDTMLKLVDNHTAVVVSGLSGNSQPKSQKKGRPAKKAKVSNSAGTAAQMRNQVAVSATVSPEDTATETEELAEVAPAEPAKAIDVDLSCENMAQRLANFAMVKPEELIISDLKWKFLIRSVLRGKNILVTGQSGTGKTKSINSVAKLMVEDHPLFIIPCGNTTDAKSILLGNTKYSPERGTYLSESEFVKAIQTPNAIVYLDEFTRLHPDGQNILMTVLDHTQRELVLDEAEGCPTIKVAPGVCFMATANIGKQYSATRSIDRALLDRFNVTFEMEPLEIMQELELIFMEYGKPAIKMRNEICKVLDVIDSIRKDYNNENTELTTFISTRPVLEIAGLLLDGFSPLECIEVCIYPLYSDDGGTESERALVKKIVQKAGFAPADQTI
jgi:MoxR-like ATPase